jgi:hypothetical protein
MSGLEQSRTIFEILAGKAIGPFRLGMTRAQVRKIAERELRAEVNAEAAADTVGDTGITILYDKKGRCQHITAVIGSVPGRNAFTLFGEDIRGVEDEFIIRLCESHWLFVNCEYWGINAPLAGFSANYRDEFREHDWDGTFESVIVKRPDWLVLPLAMFSFSAKTIISALLATVGIGAFLAVADAARSVRFIGSFVDGLTTIVFFSLFLFLWRQFGNWLTKGDFSTAIASTVVNLIVAFFALGSRPSQGQLDALHITWFVLTVAWLLHIIWRTWRAIDQRTRITPGKETAGGRARDTGRAARS